MVSTRFAAFLMLAMACPSIALEYATPLESSSWESSGSVYGCSLVHEVTDYGKAKFEHEAGAARQFRLETPDPRFDVGTLVVAEQPPLWRPEERGTHLVTVKHTGGAVNLEAHETSRILTTLQRGLEVKLSGPLTHSLHDSVQVVVSPTRFKQAYEAFVGCERQLLPVSYNQIERTRVNYGAGGHVVPSRSKRVLDNIAVYLAADDSVTQVFVDGHTDNKGLTRDNIAISQRRAFAVRDYLLSRGVAPERIVTRYHGDKYPTVDNRNQRNRAQNRRTTIRLSRDPIVVQEPPLQGPRPDEPAPAEHAPPEPRFTPAIDAEDLVKAVERRDAAALMR